VILASPPVKIEKHPEKIKSSKANAADAKSRAAD